MPQVFDYTYFILSHERKSFIGNTIKLHIDRLAGEKQDETHKDELHSALRKRFGWSALKLTRVLNNTDRLTIEQMFVTAQLLGTSLDQLIKSCDRPKMIVA